MTDETHDDDRVPVRDLWMYCIVAGAFGGCGSAAMIIGVIWVLAS